MSNLRNYPAILLLLIALYMVATLPYLNLYPRIESAQIGIIAPAHKLATEGIYGNDLFTGFHKTERLNYEYMPLYPLAVAASFKLFGTGIWQARLVSVICGLVALLLTFRLASLLFDKTVGLLAIAVLTLLPIAIPQWESGQIYPGSFPFLDNARVVRYDIMVPVWVLASCLSFRRAYLAESRIWYGLAGIAVGLATLTHLYGAFILAVFGLLLFWRDGKGMLGRPDAYLLIAAWLLTLSPWVAYVLQDYAAYQGQMTRHSYRFAGLDWRFFADNLYNEFHRYLRIIGTPRPSRAWLRLSPWLMGLGLISAEIHLFKTKRINPTFATRFTLIVVPVLTLLLGLLLNLKRYAYLMLVYPFWAIYLALALVIVWRNLAARADLWALWQRRIMLSLGVGVACSGLLGIGRMLADARAIASYDDLSNSLAAQVPQDARVVMLHDMWLGFADHTSVRSIDTVFVLSASPLPEQRVKTAKQVMDDFNPDYVVLSLNLLTLYDRSPERFRPIVGDAWQQVETFLSSNCQLLSQTNASANYDAYGIYRCTGGRT